MNSRKNHNKKLMLPVLIFLVGCLVFAGCRDFDDFLDYTDHRFRKLVHPDERDSVETSIWKQIDAKTSGNCAGIADWLLQE